MVGHVGSLREFVERLTDEGRPAKEKDFHMIQLSLFYRDQETAQRLTTAFLSALEDGQWHLRRDLVQAIPGLTERAARLIAEHSRGAVIGSSRGYKLTVAASVEELDHAERQLISQASKMKARAVEIRKARNRGGVAA